VQLKLKTDYGLRVLLYLAHHEARHAARQAGPPARDDPRRGTSGNCAAPVSSEAIAQAFDISKDHVVKVVQDLARHGWVVTRSGRGGGIVLAVDPAGLAVDEVVAAFEPRQGVLECVEHPAVCVLEPGCDLRRLLIEAEQAFYGVLAGRTIADLVARRPRRGGIHHLSLPGA
jgi:Rrf2 family nitric oxide-sensitive transcriptional repressor